DSPSDTPSGNDDHFSVPAHLHPSDEQIEEYGPRLKASAKANLRTQSDVADSTPGQASAQLATMFTCDGQEIYDLLATRPLVYEQIQDASRYKDLDCGPGGFTNVFANDPAAGTFMASAQIGHPTSEHEMVVLSSVSIEEEFESEDVYGQSYDRDAKIDLLSYNVIMQGAGAGFHIEQSKLAEQELILDADPLDLFELGEQFDVVQQSFMDLENSLKRMDSDKSGIPSWGSVIEGAQLHIATVEYEDYDEIFIVSEGKYAAWYGDDGGENFDVDYSICNFSHKEQTLETVHQRFWADPENVGDEVLEILSGKTRMTVLDDDGEPKFVVDILFEDSEITFLYPGTDDDITFFMDGDDEVFERCANIYYETELAPSPAPDS
ncbi:hypothetical protein LRD18_12775, partial [Halorhodospira halochloris]|uniref:hypothetical protein n=1 Tax=Halorhodospira halochloris TaxID=1052 RepID=UPI001EE8AC5C